MLRIEGRSPQRSDFSLDDFSAELDENALLSRDLGWDEGTTSSSSSYTSDSEEKGEEEVKQLVLNRKRG